ncbi:MAG: DUF3311 domain-containing protein [Jatrophihabitantaceae bacterium]
MSTDTSTQRPAGDGDPPRRGPLPVGAKVIAGLLLLVPMVALALVPTYSSETPKLWGFPFFYWYQLLWVIVTPVFTWSAYLVITKARGEKR